MKKNNPPHRGPGNDQHALRLLFALLPFFFFASTSLCRATGGDPKKYHESGVLTSVEGKKSVTINEKGYDVDPSVLIENAAGRPIPLNKLTIPSAVTFEYSYMPTTPQTMAPIIVYIKETKKVTRNKRPARNKRSSR